MLFTSNAEHWLTLSYLPGLGCSTIHRLVESAGSPSLLLQGRAALATVPGLSARWQTLLGNAIAVRIARQRAIEELYRLKAQDIFLITPDHPDYPEALEPFPDRPVCLYCRGDITCLKALTLAIVGARSASDYGYRISMTLAADLAAEGACIVSGAAYGIDAAAHRGALKAGGATVAVLGCGVDVIYPASHARLLEEIAEKGALISEYPLGTAPEGFRFPVRNRIISGLSSAVIVVEAAERSGSLITARLALDQGREVFAVPGRVDSEKSAGTHRLIQQGAYLIHTAKDVLDELSWGHAGQPPRPGLALPEQAKPLSLSLEEERILESLGTYPLDIDSIIQTSGLSAGQVHAALLHLELQQLIRQIPGQLYERSGGR